MSMTFELFPYQRDAYDVFMQRGSLLLAFDTGLGKTATATAISEKLLAQEPLRGPGQPQVPVGQGASQEH
jgi:superfamily II DNA or RNA helicase